MHTYCDISMYITPWIILGWEHKFTNHKFKHNDVQQIV